MGTLIGRFRAVGVAFEAAPDGKLRAHGTLTDELCDEIRKYKPAILAELAANDADLMEARRRRVVALLEEHTDWRYGLVIENEPGLVVVHIGIRGVASGEVVIDKAQYDSVEFMKWLDGAVVS
jgi:hypothetical protein